jgi:hypothetical protein
MQDCTILGVVIGAKFFEYFPQNFHDRELVAAPTSGRRGLGSFTVPEHSSGVHLGGSPFKGKDTHHKGHMDNLLNKERFQGFVGFS